jgi:hypothetical protein
MMSRVQDLMLGFKERLRGAWQKAYEAHRQYGIALQQSEDRDYSSAYEGDLLGSESNVPSDEEEPVG